MCVSVCVCGLRGEYVCHVPNMTLYCSSTYTFMDTICTTILSIIVSKGGVHCLDIQVDVRVIGIRTCQSIR